MRPRSAIYLASVLSLLCAGCGRQPQNVAYTVELSTSARSEDPDYAYFADLSCDVIDGAGNDSSSSTLQELPAKATFYGASIACTAQAKDQDEPLKMVIFRPDRTIVGRGVSYSSYAFVSAGGH